MARLGENRYGKARVRLSRITRTAERHEFNEWTVRVLLQGDFESSFTAADNSKILPTDTMKNTVYSIARGSKRGHDRRIRDGTWRLFSRQQSPGFQSQHRNRRENAGSDLS